MALRINNNIAAQKALRFLGENDRKLVKSLERLSSGFRINSGADDPAGLVISERMRAQIAGVNQAIANTELATAMVQTTEGALGEINNLLIRMRELALAANNEGANDVRALEANQIEIANAIESIQRISSNTQFGTRKLLDGSSGVGGVGQGGGVSFVSANERVRNSPVEGFPIEVTQIPTKALLEGVISEDDVPGLSLTLIEGGKTVTIKASENDVPATIVGKLKNAAAEVGLAVNIELIDDTLIVEAEKFGSAEDFRGISSVAGVLSSEAGIAERPTPGLDIEGTIGGETAVGRGLELAGVTGNENTQSLRVRVTGEPIREFDDEGNLTITREFDEGVVGTVHVVNSSVAFQTGPNPGQQTSFALPLVSPSGLGRQATNASGFQNVGDIDVTNPQGARDSILLIDAAIDDLTLARGRLGAFQRNNLDTNLATLRVTAENLISAESTIRDSVIAEELVEFTRHRIQLEANTALLAQANQIPATVITLLK